MTKQEIKEVVKQYMEDPDFNLLSYLLSDIKETMAFITESSDLEFASLADYFEELAYMSQSKEFVECIRSRFIKIKDKSLDLRYICACIGYADEVFPQEEY